MTTNKLYIDLETTINCEIGKNKASPFDPDNRIVWLGWKASDYNELETFKEKASFKGDLDNRFEVDPNPGWPDLVIAQNIAFDLHHLMMEDVRWERAVKRKGFDIWDTMLAEYLLTGQAEKMVSLDELSKKYGGTVKDSRMKEYWGKGICTSKIPDDEIQPYLEEDVKNLEIIYNAQRAKAIELGMLPLIESQMEARLATIVMEFNGMAFDKEKAEDLTVDIEREYNKVNNACKAAMNVVLSELEEDEINPNSNSHVSAVLFGGEIKVTRKKPMRDEKGNVVKFKSGIKKGTTRYKNVEHIFHTDGLYKSPNQPNARGEFPVNTVVLSKLKDDTGLVENILKLREFKKQISTYFKGYSELVFPDGTIHGSLNHCLTNTGRLSSSSPNLQNISNKGVD